MDEGIQVDEGIQESEGIQVDEGIHVNEGIALESGDVVDGVVHAREVRLPSEPTVAEREQHALSHLPMRAWCAACVTASARDAPHRLLWLQPAR